jgi:hypothetical protein
MDRDELTAWAMGNGWRMVGGFPSLVKPGRPNEAIVRIACKATVASLEVKKPAGKWEKVGSAKYAEIGLDEAHEWPSGIGLEKVPSISMLMRENKDQAIFAKFGK